MEKIRNFLINRSRGQKISIIIFSDIFIFNFVFIYSFFLISIFFNFDSTLFFKNKPILSSLADISIFRIFISNLISISLIYYLRGYKSFFRVNSNFSLIGKERIYGSFVFCVLLGLFVFENTNNFLIALNSTFFIFMLTCFLHLSLRSILYKFLSKNISNEVVPILIYGAGQAGRETAAQLSQNPKYKVIGFIDDNSRLKGFKILGHNVLGGPNKLIKIKKNYPNILVVLAIIAIQPKERKKIISILEDYKVQVKTIPTNYGALEAKLEIDNLTLNDLIERETFDPDNSFSLKKIKNKNILITGAGGSIGSELAYQISNLNPSNLILVDLSEFNLYKLERKLKNINEKNLIKFILLDIQDSDEVEKIIKKYKIDIIFHAAAYKHVPILQKEENYFVALKNNFFATYKICEISQKNQIESFVLVSSDKAVNPTNIMGATKRLAELSLQAFQQNKKNNTCFSIVRFGNVLNSSGSVVPLFWDQIYKGGPVTVTHEKINRFFMTIEEASHLVIEANSMAKGGEVFLLDMGKPIEIKELAKKMIHLSGNSVAESQEDSGIEIRYTGLRPGEKLYEELLLSKNPLSTIHSKIKKGSEKSLSFEEMLSLKNNLWKEINQNNLEEVERIISKNVDGYKNEKSFQR